MDISQQIATIRIGANYFKENAKKEYSNLIAWIWIREAFQNSSDAGAKHIDVIVRGDTIEVRDDGCGMTDEIIMDRLLVLGGSYKENQNSTGGFGEAKKVLFFAWEEWYIQSHPDTRNEYYVDSSMIGNSPIRHLTGYYNKGTTIHIKFNPNDTNMDRETWMRCITDYISTCTTRAEVTLNGTIMETMQVRGKKKDYDFATVVVNKSKPSKRILVRINGITMFTEEINVRLSATVIVDLKGNSIEKMSTSRERLLYPYDRKLSNIVQSFVVNPVSAIRDHSEKIYMDEYKARVKKAKNVLDQIEDRTIRTEVYDVLYNYSEPDAIIERIERIDPVLATKMRIVLQGYYESSMGYTFRVRRDKKRKPYPDPECNKVQSILHSWKLIVDALMKKSYPDKKYMVGLTYVRDKKDETGEKACWIYEPSEDMHYILINPTYVKKFGSPVALGHYLFQKGCHEISHIEFPNHNEQFSMKWSVLMEFLYLDLRFWTKLFKQAKKEVRDMGLDIDGVFIGEEFDDLELEEEETDEGI